ncbi:MAG: NAD(P)/FAD-dependent oxidoreductase [Deltaproteobacteria bacterium]|nr:NAD(P)/FAD-dependent oxidoreductase [Deltaproteobacteria bacterium]MBW2071402.1 NAD(P)/FAD-dependent oxidoreductase [Deltaproteobacteria bacterium]
MRVVIIGAGPAGLTVAETLRNYDMDSEIVLYAAEPFPPYAPPAIVDYLVSGREETLFWKGKEFCDQLRIDYRPGISIQAVETDNHDVVEANNRKVHYDTLVIATGSRLYAPIEGSDLPGIYNFKSLTAARSLMEKVRQGQLGSAVIVGAGFIGMEVSLLLRQLGLAVTIIEMQDRVMPRVLDRETADMALGTLKARGVEVRLDTKAVTFEGEREVEGVRLDSGEIVQGEVYVAASGVKPNTEFLNGSGIDLGWGVVVDDYLRTSRGDVYAAGDVAETHDLLTGERYVHAIFPNAVAQGRIVAANIMGKETRYEGAESMNSLKHLGLPLVAVGHMHADEELRFRCGNVLRKIFLKDGRIVGFRLTGDIRGAGVYRSLMLRRVDVAAYKDRLLSDRFGIADLMIPY